MDLLKRLGRWSTSTPDAVAVVSATGRRHTYRELETRTAHLARYLRSLGVGPEVVVGVRMARRFEAVVVLLAIVRVGGVYLPLDPAHPPTRLAGMVAAAGARLVVADPGSVADLAAEGTEVLDADLALAARPEAGDPAGDPVHGAGDDNLMCVLFTSGSTGTPKGIGMCPPAVRNVVNWADRSGRPWRCAQFSSPGFDMSLQEIFGTLAAGGTLVQVGEEHRADPTLLLRLLAAESVDRIYLSPTLLHQLAEAWQAGGELPARLRHIVVAGEPLRLTASVRKLVAALPDAVLENQYGPTETHQATAYPMTGPPDAWPDRPALGRPLAAVTVHLLDEHGSPVAPGTPGEVFLGGPVVARGYVGRPALTAAYFLPDPFSGRPGARMYRTGDLAEWTADGTLVFLGRIDDQVKIRGFRVEPAEVEAALTEDPRIRAVAVRADRRTDGTSQLVAYVVPRTPDLDERAVRAAARTRLPGYMVPRSVVLLPALPVNRNGKVDRTALCLPATGVTDVTAPETAEDLMCRLWQEVLERTAVGPDDNFMDLGGDSLAAMQLATRIGRAFGSTITVRAVLDHPTPRELTSALERLVLAELDTTGCGRP
ncbi:non-ribosomal peptide synthetase [Micromonospora zhanjiangensis]